MSTKKASPIKDPESESEQASGGETSPSEAPSQALSRGEQVRLAAYLAAERRGFAPGYEVEDWITAEQEVDAAARAPDGAQQI